VTDRHTHTGKFIFCPCYVHAFVHEIWEISLVESDASRLTDSFTYCNNSGTVTSWIDHFLCSKKIDQLIDNVDILYNYTSSDHKPLLLLLSDVGVSGTLTLTYDEQVASVETFLTDWKHCDDISLQRYRYVLDNELSRIDNGRQVCLHLGCAQGQDRGQRS